ncbi:MAG: glycosyltransferase [Bacteroidales bacterium]|nr:glycosyltransferase [Bacteroidales bacterium]
MTQNEINIVFPIIGGETRINNRLVSRKANSKNLYEGISKHTNCFEMPIEKIIEEKSDEYDYIWVDITDTKALLFLLREQDVINKPFLIKLPVVFGDLLVISQIIPLLKKEDVIFTPSDFARDSFKKISEHINIQTLTNTINVTKIRENLIIKPEESFKRLCFLGRIVPDKGIKFIIESLPSILENAGDVRLDIIGPLNGEHIGEDTKSVFVKELELLARDLQIEDKITWHGTLMSNAKYEILSKADLLINPSIFMGETFGVVNIEALACGVPVICTKWTGFPEIIQHGSNGFLIDAINIGHCEYSINTDQLIEYVSLCLTDQVLMGQLKEGAINKSYEYDEDTVFKKFTTVLKSNQSLDAPNWDIIKNKTISDYFELFHDDFVPYLKRYNIDGLKIGSIINKFEMNDTKNLKEIFLEIVKSWNMPKEYLASIPGDLINKMIHVYDYLHQDIHKNVPLNEKQDLFNYLSSIN